MLRELKEKAAYFNKSLAEVTNIKDSLEGAIIIVAKEKACVNPQPVDCISCCMDCPFAGDKLEDRVLEKAKKICMAIELGAFDNNLANKPI
jgi:hypothetical protein